MSRGFPCSGLFRATSWRAARLPLAFGPKFQEILDRNLATKKFAFEVIGLGLDSRLARTLPLWVTYPAAAWLYHWRVMWLLGSWLAIWLIGSGCCEWLCGSMAVWLAAYVAALLCRWLAGCCGSMAVGGWLAGSCQGGWLSGWLVVWVAGYMIVWLAGYVAMWLAGLLYGCVCSWLQLGGCAAGELVAGLAIGNMVGWSLTRWLVTGWLCSWLHGCSWLAWLRATWLGMWLADGWQDGWLLVWRAIT